MEMREIIPSNNLKNVFSSANIMVIIFNFSIEVIKMKVGIIAKIIKTIKRKLINAIILYLKKNLKLIFKFSLICFQLLLIFF